MKIVIQLWNHWNTSFRRKLWADHHKSMAINYLFMTSLHIDGLALAIWSIIAVIDNTSYSC